MLSLVCVGTFMSTLDVSIVNVALPTLTAYFNTNVGASQWFVLAYTFVITVLLMLFAKLGDNIGRRKLYIWGTLIFVVGSLLCASSMSAIMLILSRGLQGVGSAITMSAGPALITEAFTPSRRGRALGLVGTSVALGLLAGPVVGGLIVTYADWRWMFLINIPIGMLLAVLLCVRVNGFDSANGKPLDFPGAALLGLALAALVLGLTYGDALGWPSPATIAIFVGALVLGAAFIAVERRVRHPLVDLGLFSNREFSIGAFAGWTNYAAMMPISVFMPFYLENLLKYQPNEVGMILAAGPLTLALVAPFAGMLSDRIGSRLLTTSGLVITGLGITLMRQLDTGSAWPDVVWRLVLANLGSALFVTPNSSAILGSVRPRELGVASGTIALMRNLGMLCGIALAGAIITTTQKSSYLTPEVRPTQQVQYYIFFTGLKNAFQVGAVIAWIGAFFSSLRVRPGDREAFDEASGK